MKTKIVPSPFHVLGDHFRDNSVFACSAAESGAALRRKGVNTEIFRYWLFQYGELAL